jgi:hypothetical protein
MHHLGNAGFNRLGSISNRCLGWMVSSRRLAEAMNDGVEAARLDGRHLKVPGEDVRRGRLNWGLA